MPSGIVRGIRRRFRRLSPCLRQVAYVLLTRAPVAGSREQALYPAAPRLACVKPVASVHPEPGSNSSLLIYLFFFFFKSKKNRQTYQCLLFCIKSEPFPSDGPRIPNRSETDSYKRRILSFVWNLTEILWHPSWPQRRRTVYSSLVLLHRCNHFNVLLFPVCPRASPKCFAKLRRNFEPCKTFWNFN